MATVLTKPLRRRIGDLVVTLSESHVEIRRRRHKRGVRIALAEAIAAADQVRAPRGWMPKTGDVVAVLPWRHKARVGSVIQAVPELLVRITFRRGTERIVELGRLVPVGNDCVMVRCERTPSSGTTEPSGTLF